MLKLFKIIKNRIKKNRFVRGIYCYYRHYYGYSRLHFGHLDKDVSFMPPMTFSNPRNVFIYGNVQLGPGHISAFNAKFIMKKGCAVAGGLRVQTGNHARIVGTFVGDVTENIKPDGYDRDVIVEEDVWLGANVTLLSGVTIGRGSTVAAGAIVTKSMPPYCVCGGVPAKFIKFYWTIDEIMQHELRLYPEEERLSRDVLEEYFVRYNSKQ